MLLKSLLTRKNHKYCERKKTVHINELRGENFHMFSVNAEKSIWQKLSALSWYKELFIN